MPTNPHPSRNSRLGYAASAILLLMLFVQAVSAQTSSFSPPVYFGARPAPYFMQIADLDGDGFQDVVTGSLYASGISILYGNPDGSLTPTDPVLPTVETAYGSYDVKVADLDGDGDQDILVSHIYSNTTIRVLTNEGGRQFTLEPYALLVSGWTGPASIHIADFNSDSKPDIITNSYRIGNGNETGFVSIFLQGDSHEFGDYYAANLRLGREFSGNQRLEFFVVADLDRDGDADVATSNHKCNGYSMSVLLGDGHGNLSLTGPVYGRYCEEVGGIVAGDINRDGNMDLVQTDFNSGDLFIYRGIGSGAFTTSIIHVGGITNQPSIADVNDDGFLDILVPNTNGGEHVSILYGDGTGNFPTSSILPNPGTPVSVLAADMNGDHRLDIVAVNAYRGNLAPEYSNSSSVSVHYNVGGMPSDTTGPSLVIAPTAPANEAGWHNSNVTVTISATDEPGGSGLDRIEYSAIGGQAIPLTTAPSSPASFSVTTEGVTTITAVAYDRAGNSTTSALVIMLDKTAPAVEAPDMGATATRAGGAEVSFAPAVTDSLSGVASVICSPPSGSAFPLGKTTVTCIASDAADNIATRTFEVWVTFSWSGVLQPVDADGSSVFKLGRPIPVKFRLTGASAGIQNAVANLSYQRLGAVNEMINEADQQGGADSGSRFRYDAAADQYIFNMDTRTLSSGRYRLIIDLHDGVSRSVEVAMR
jgi:hypothetical protein